MIAFWLTSLSSFLGFIVDLGPAQLSTRFHRSDSRNRDRGRGGGGAGGGGGDRFPPSRGGGGGGGGGSERRHCDRA